MMRLIVAAAVCVFVGDLAGKAVAAPVSEAVVEEACGDDIEGGCTKTTCATACEKWEDGKLYSYGCLFPNKPGATAAKCSKDLVIRRTVGSSAGQATGGVDAGAGGGTGAGTITGGFGTRLQKGGAAAPAP